ncbi:type IV toxin-antitoxin system AbiEi family antitoxin domain-containing protein [Arthrobacter sp. ISL-85]|uniref:type IV toxin-antitoxin system AbiEi family antitoxin domain-containing protein n=1 Tax=Arthrobacter sp. ISL-85 TaxID=2819115 RepID=UPI0020352D0E|nr:type IV toxin-antitoxin system AbiEi family antitoxin domain-containing protein [Arthrobacter sp. ISL-85]
MHLISAQDLRRASGDTRSLSRRFAQGELVRVRRGVYADKAEWLSLAPWERYFQTVRAVDVELPGSTFCLDTAAVAWGLDLLGVPGHVHVCGASRGHTGRQQPITAAAPTRSGRTGLEDITGYGIHRHRGQPEGVQREGLLVTPLPETVIGVIARESFTAGVVLADHAISGRRISGPPVSKDELAQAACALPAQARRSWVSAVLDFADANSESPGESLSRAQMHLLGFPAPMLQAKFRQGGSFLGRPDFFWPRYRLIGEFDGDAKYLSDDYLGTRTARQTVLAEKKREDRLRAKGFRFVRWDWATASDPARFAACLRQAGLPNTRSRPGTR